MSFGLSRGRTLDPGQVGLRAADLPPIPDNIISDPTAGHLDPRQWFPLRDSDPSRPFEIEIGSGKGTFLIQHAQANPGIDTLGFEWAKEFFAYAADRARRHNLDNARLVHDDATEFLRWRMPDAIIDTIHLYFSDPWPKRRHHKNRVIQDRFLADTWRVLKPGGQLKIVTDHDDLWSWNQIHFSRWTEPNSNPDSNPTPGFDGPHPAFELQSFQAQSSANPGELVGSNFERKYQREGRPFHAAVLQKPNPSNA